METRHLVLAGRLAAIIGILALRGRRRAMSWAAHDFLWLYPTLRRNCSWHGEVLTHFETQERAVWLTIDDGPGSTTPDILDVLARHNAKATFFGIGRKIAANRSICERILAEGHTLENHTQSHPAGWWWIMPRPFVRREIETNSETILSTTGQRPRYFRSPVGMNNPSVHPIASELGLRVTGWSAEGCDGCPTAPTAVATRIMRAIFPGAIILMHENEGSRHPVVTVSRILEKLDEADYRAVIPSESALR
jgi:peptidoglycan-N-acetylglucosamine deacetylase